MQSNLLRLVILLQFVVLGFVLYQADLTRNFLQKESPDAGDHSSVVEDHNSADLASTPERIYPDFEGMDEQRLRQVIRSELAAFAGPLTDQNQEVAQREPAIDPYENQLQLDVVKDQLSYYSEIGFISDVEMQNLQLEISRLDPENRKLMLRRLSAAIATGKIEGRF